MNEEMKMKCKILIVDDVDTNRFVLRDIIQEMGYQPLLAENGEQALKIVERLKPQLIISDIAMPVMDGYELCTNLKKQPVTRDIPVIFISAFDNAEDMIKGFEIGCEDYIIKPFIPAVVKARVGLHLKLFEVNQELVDSNARLQKSITEQLRQIEMEKKNVLYALTRVAQENAAYDIGHMNRICEDCRILAEAMQLSDTFGSKISDDFIENIAVAAPLCDIGNVAISTDLLQKKEPLLAEETQEIKKHPLIGGRIIKDVLESGDYNEFLQMSYEITMYHHENWDGSGYPNGIKGDDIPLPAQLVSVISSYCAMTEERSYRPAYDVDEALRLMELDSGTKYNPAIFDIMKKISRQFY